MLGHHLEAFRAVNFKWRFPTHDPWRQHQVWVSSCIVRMQMRKEDRSQCSDAEAKCCHPVLISCRRTTHDSWPEVDQIGGNVDDDRGRRSRTRRIGTRRPGSQHNHLSICGPEGRLLVRVARAARIIFFRVKAADAAMGALQRSGRLHSGGRSCASESRKNSTDARPVVGRGPKVQRVAARLSGQRTLQFRGNGRPSLIVGRKTMEYFPGMMALPDAASPPMLKVVDDHSGHRGTTRNGMIVTHGGLEGGYGLYLRDGKPTFVYILR
jgi:hypothetical protein